MPINASRRTAPHATTGFNTVFNILITAGFSRTLHNLHLDLGTLVLNLPQVSSLWMCYEQLSIHSQTTLICFVRSTCKL